MIISTLLYVIMSFRNLINSIFSKVIFFFARSHAAHAFFENLLHFSHAIFITSFIINLLLVIKS